MAEAKERREGREEERRRRGRGRGTVNLHKFDILGESGASCAIPVAASSPLSPLSVFRPKTLSQSKRPHLGGQPTNIPDEDMADISVEVGRTWMTF